MSPKTADNIKPDDVKIEVGGDNQQDKKQEYDEFLKKKRDNEIAEAEKNKKIDEKKVLDKKKQQEEIAKDIEDAEKNSKKWKFWRYIFAIVSKTFKLYVKEIECAEKITSLASKKNRTELEQTELSGNITEYRKIKKDIENKDKTAENNTTQENKKTPQSAISIKQDDKPEVTTAPNNTTHQDKEKNRDNTENLVKTRE